MAVAAWAPTTEAAGDEGRPSERQAAGYPSLKRREGLLFAVTYDQAGRGTCPNGRDWSLLQEGAPVLTEGTGRSCRRVRLS